MDNHPRLPGTSNPFSSPEEAEAAMLRIGGIPKSSIKGPGGYKRNRKPETSQEKGAAQEKAIKASFEQDGIKARRNFQGGVNNNGLSNPDVSAMRGWHFESKNEKTVRFPDYVRQLKQDCPATNRGGIIFNHDGELWLSIRLKDKANFAQDFIEACGFLVIPND